MPVVTLRDLYVAELQNLYDAEQQILRELPGMAARATSGELRVAFERHYEQTQVHIERLDLLFRQLTERPHGASCEGIRGIIADAQRQGAETERGEVLDAALIAAAQRIEHFEMAGYGCARTHAQVLSDPDAARILGQTLDEEAEVDRTLTQIAQHGINQRAGEDLVPHATTYRSRLRYIAASDLPAFRYGSYRIVDADGGDLGRIDGFIVDDRNGKPIYHVVDSGGWFSGRRYVIPVAQLEPDESEAIFRTELSREQLRRYPEFSPSAFAAMDDDDAARYEKRLLDAVLPYRHETASAGRAYYDELPLYQPPGWLMSGLWPVDPMMLAGLPPAPVDTDDSTTTDAASKPTGRHAEPSRPESGAQAEADAEDGELLATPGSVSGRRSTEPTIEQRRIEKYRER